jgi:hypothetical protein
MPSPRGLGIVAYLLFPVALGYWLSGTTFNECLDCGGRWQRGVHIVPRRSNAPAKAPEPEIAPPPPEDRAGMYAEQVPAAAVVRRRARLGAPVPVAAASQDIEIKAAPSACRVCRQVAGRYAAQNAPALPIVGCRCEGGCTCTVAPAED